MAGNIRCLKEQFFFAFHCLIKQILLKLSIKLENFQDPVLLFPYLVLPLKTVRTEAGKLQQVKHYLFF